MKIFIRSLTRWTFKQSPFETLKCTSDSKKELKTQFYKLSQNLHPDKTLHLSEEERRLKTAEFIQLQTAYDVLRDPASRKAYLDSTHSSARHHRHPNHSSAHRHRHQHQYQYHQPGDEKMLNDLQVWVFGFAFLGFVYFIMTRNYSNSQEREQLIAWSIYNAKRREQGLEGVVGSKPDGPNRVV
jgi:DnaJ-class molecular chaperone